MGEVWLVENSDIGRPVVLKRILKEVSVTGQLEPYGVILVSRTEPVKRRDGSLGKE